MRPFLVLAGTCALFLAGCGKFFQPPSNTPTPGSSGNNLYVANPGSAATNPATLATLAGFAIGTSTLTALPSSPYGSATGALGALSMVMSPNNKFLYESTTSNGIFVYTVNADGSLTLGNGNLAVATGVIGTAMKIDPLGGWLLVADANSQQALSYQINTTTGVLTNTATNRVGLHAGAPNHMLITPNGQFVYVSLGQGGVDVLTFNATTGAMVLQPGPLIPKTAASSDQGMATDPNGVYLFVAETGGTGLRQFTIGSGGALAEVAGSPRPTGLGPSAVLVDTTGSYVYVANRTDGTITGFVLTAAGSMTPISSSPFKTGTVPIDMVEDTTKTYVAVVNSGGTPDLQLFKFNATVGGQLDLVTSMATGTDPTNPIAIVATH